MSDRNIRTLVLSLNAIYLATLFGFIGFRLVSGLAAVPQGYAPLLIASAIAIPMACIGFGNFLRLRRDA
jgi:hypothetical protein